MMKGRQVVVLLALVAAAGCAGTLQAGHDQSSSTARYACAALPAPSGAGGSMLAARFPVSGVEPLSRVDRVGKIEMRRIAGAKIVVPAEPGLTAQYLERAVACEIGRYGADPGAAAAASSDPLAVPGVTASVRSGGAYFVVDLVAKTNEAGREVLRRAQGAVYTARAQ